MFKDKKRNLILGIVFFQIYLGIISGVIIVIITSKFNVPENVWIENLHLVDMKKLEIKKNVEEYFYPKLDKGFIVLKTKGEDFEIKFDKIDVKLNAENLESEVIGDGNPKFIKNNIEGYFFFRKRNVEPEFVYDELKLRYILMEYAKVVDVEPEEPKIRIENEEINISDSKNGYKFNIDKVMKNIKDKISVSLKVEVVGEIKEMKARIEKKDLLGIKILGTKKIDISNIENKEEIVKVVDLLDNLIILPNDIWSYQKKKNFSFSNLLFKNGINEELSKVGYSCILEPLYELILTSDISKEDVEVIMKENQVNLKNDEITKKMQFKDISFFNNSKLPIVILIEKNSGEINLKLLGKSRKQLEK